MKTDRNNTVLIEEGSKKSQRTVRYRRLEKYLNRNFKKQIETQEQYSTWLKKEECKTNINCLSEATDKKSTRTNDKKSIVD